MTKHKNRDHSPERKKKHKKHKKSKSKDGSKHHKKRDEKPKKENIPKKQEKAPPAEGRTEYVITSVRNEGAVISAPSKAIRGKVTFNKLCYDLVGLGLNYSAALVDDEIFKMVQKGKDSRDWVKFCDVSTMELTEAPNWQFNKAAEESSSEEEHNDDDDPNKEESSEFSEDEDYDPGETSPESFAKTLLSDTAEFTHCGWTFFLRVNKMKVSRDDVSAEEYQRLKAFHHEKVVFLVEKIVVDMGYKEPEED